MSDRKRTEADDTAATLAPWKVLERTNILSRKPWVEVWEQTLELPDGRVVEEFYEVGLRDYVTIIAETGEGDVLFERQYKHGVGRVSLTVPAGHVEAGEDPLDAAKRELLEETGHSASDWRPLGAFVIGGNARIGTVHAYHARGAVYHRPPNSGDLEEMEHLKLKRPAIKDAFARGDIVMVGSALPLALWLADIAAPEMLETR